MMGRLSKVRRRAGPPLAEVTKMSLLTPAAVERMKAMWVPSGEYTGAWSRDPGGGEVSTRVLESAMDKTEMVERVGSPAVIWEKASNLLSGDQDNPSPMHDSP